MNRFLHSWYFTAFVCTAMTVLFTLISFELIAYLTIGRTIWLPK